MKMMYPLIETLTSEDAQLDFGNVQPAPMFGRMMNLQSFHKSPRFRWWKRLVERGELVGVQVIADEDDPLGIRIIDVQQLLDLFGPVDFGSSFSDVYLSPARQGLSEHEVCGCAIALILEIDSLRLALLGRNGLSGFPNQLGRLFIHADHRNLSIVGPLVHLQHILHVHHEIRVLLRRNYPALTQVRLEFVFLSVLRTVWSEIDSTISKVTSLSAKSCRVHFDRPAGGWLHAKAIKRASF